MFIYLLILLVTLIAISIGKKVFYFKGRGIPYTYPLFFGLEMLFQNPTTINIERRKKYGKLYGSYFASLPIIVVGDPQIAQGVNIKEFSSFTDRNPIKFNMKYLADGFFFKNKQEWKEGRALVSPVFTTKRIKDIFGHFQRASKPLFLNIEEHIKEGKQDEIDIKDLLKGFSLDVIGKFVFALELNSAKDQNHPFVKAVRKMVNFDATLFNVLLSVLPEKIINYFDIQFFDKEATEYIANTTRVLMKQRQENKEEYNDFLDMLMTSIREKNLDVPENEIIGNTILFFFAGLETVSTTVCNALYCLIMNPERQEKLYNALIEVYPDKQITYDNIKDVPLLKATLFESQRLMPAVNLNLRVCERDVEICGFQFKTGDVVGIDVFSFHNSEDFWAEPEKFMPERFLEKDFKIENDESQVFMPFGAGPRACIASRMAFIESAFVIGQLVLNYEIYRSSKTSVPPKYSRTPQQLVYKSMVMGFKKRDDNNNLL